MLTDISVMRSECVRMYVMMCSGCEALVLRTEGNISSGHQDGTLSVAEQATAERRALRSAPVMYLTRREMTDPSHTARVRVRNVYREGCFNI